jgi:hypothetical protein
VIDVGVLLEIPVKGGVSQLRAVKIGLILKESKKNSKFLMNWKRHPIICPLKWRI